MKNKQKVDSEILLEFLKEIMDKSEENTVDQMIFKKYIELKGSINLVKYLNTNGYRVATNSSKGERLYITTDITDIIIDGHNEEINEELRLLVEKLVKYCGRAKWDKRVLFFLKSMYLAKQENSESIQ